MISFICSILPLTFACGAVGCTCSGQSWFDPNKVTNGQEPDEGLEPSDANAHVLYVLSGVLLEVENQPELLRVS